MPDELPAWFERKVPKDWFTGPLEVMADSEEILVIGTLPDVELGQLVGSRQPRRSGAEDDHVVPLRCRHAAHKRINGYRGLPLC